MKRYILLLSTLAVLGGLFFLQLSDQYPIHTISSYQQVLQEIEKADQNTLVLFDVDDTLITSPALQKEYFSWWFKLLLIMRNPRLITADWENIYSLLWQQASFHVIEPVVIDFIATLKKKGAIALALTSMESGSYGFIQSMPEWRYRMLQSMGIELSQRYPDTVFENFPVYRSGYPILYKGILCANQQDKGKVLHAFLEYAQWHPSNIIAFDDSQDALEAIGTVCKQRAIACTLFHYEGSKKIKQIWDTQKALKQFEHLINESSKIP